MGMIFDAKKAFVNCRQKAKESLQEYTKRFNIVREILQSHLDGTIIFKKFIENQGEYDPNDTVKFSKPNSKSR